MSDPSTALTDEIIMAELPPGCRVIDLGCGDGRLLDLLRQQRNCSIQGIELNLKSVVASVGRGVPVIHADLDEGLEDIPDHSFDFAVLSQTLQQVRHPKQLLHEMLRVAHRALVVVPNFGHWRVRLQVLRTGRAPVTEALPYEWYNSPNLHLQSMHDFRDLADRLNIRIVKELSFINERPVERAWGANLRADRALYVLEHNGH